MPEGDGIHVADDAPRSSWRRGLVPEVAVVAVLVLALLAYWGDLGERLGVAAPDPLEEPALVQPPVGIDLPPAGTPRPVAAELEGGALDQAAVRRAVAGLSRARRLGPRFALLVADVDGSPVHRQGPGVVTPASTTKLLTTAAALEAMGPDQRFDTVVRREGRTLVLVGGGDPLLERTPSRDVSYPEQRADLRTLARLVAEEVGERGARRQFRLRYDADLFSGPAVSPRWPADYIRDNVVSPITALWADQGVVPNGYGARVDDPARSAAALFADHLRAAGLRVGRPAPGQAPDSAVTVAKVSSPPLGAIVQHVLETSDNEGAEVLLRHVALSQGMPGSFSAGIRAGRDLLARLGVPLRGARWVDGSGLSRANRLPVATLVDVLAVSLDEPRLARVTSGLPVAGFNGSLGERFGERSDPGLGRVRAKTGTLTGVSGLAGVVRTRDDSVLLYVAVADRLRETNTLWARERLDRISAALARCRCHVGSSP